MPASSSAAPVLDRPSPPRRPVDRIRDWVVWFGPVRLVATAVCALALAAAGFWLLRAPPPPVEASLPMASPSRTSAASVEPTTTSSTPAEIVVHVAGAVSEPGVRLLHAGARVVDAVAAAGGPTDRADLDALNLAAPLHDGDRVYIPRVGEVAELPAGVTPATSGTPERAGPVDINAADADELETLPGVGPAIAAAIVAHRDQHGPFLAVDDLAAVAGIGPAKLAALRDLVTV